MKKVQLLQLTNVGIPDKLWDDLRAYPRFTSQDGDQYILVIVDTDANTAEVIETAYPRSEHFKGGVQVVGL